MIQFPIFGEIRARDGCGNLTLSDLTSGQLEKGLAVRLAWRQRVAKCDRSAMAKGKKTGGSTRRASPMKGGRFCGNFFSESF
ncbi:hypothetical protein ACO2Q2_00420 [Dyella sp. KRB-257]|uniref:hypothetical protein n=1 Tax=Dyella sp. KRB-257 TaxID=3400915 RepID=UPI003C04DE48